MFVQFPTQFKSSHSNQNIILNNNSEVLCGYFITQVICSSCLIVSALFIEYITGCSIYFDARSDYHNENVLCAKSRKKR